MSESVLYSTNLEDYPPELIAKLRAEAAASGIPFEKYWRAHLRIENTERIPANPDEPVRAILGFGSGIRVVRHHT